MAKQPFHVVDRPKPFFKEANPWIDLERRHPRPTPLRRMTKADRAANREDAREVLGAFYADGCCVCGEADRCCLQGHHVDPKTKAFGLGQAQKTGHWSRAEVLAEVALCAPLCFNCHFKLHAGRDIVLP